MSGRAYLHIGLQKTGTSFLQSHLRDSPDELREQGVRLLPDNLRESYALMRAVREAGPWAARSEKATRRGGTVRPLARLAEQVAAADEPTVVLTQESLAAADADQAGRLLSCFAGREVHVVLTVRDVARQLPSLWQQRVKAGFDVSFVDFLDLARSGRRAVGRSVASQLDLPAILDRWSDGLPPEQVHLVVVPPAGSAPDLLAERFGAVVGVDYSRLVMHDARPNVSLDPVQAELVRRVNRVVDLGKAEHAKTVKQYFSARVLAPHRGAPARTPRSMTAWCQEVAARQVRAVREGGYAVSGDLEDLVPTPDSFVDAVPEVDDAAVTEAAVRAIATMLEEHDRKRRRSTPPETAGPDRVS